MTSVSTLPQAAIDWLLAQGVSAETIFRPNIIGMARGHRAADGIFEFDETGPAWFTIDEERDCAYWRPKTGEICTAEGRLFGLGQDDVANPGATALGQWLTIHETPLQWLQAGRTGLVVIRWEWSFEWLRHVERIAVPEALLATYTKAMKPRLPEVGVIPRQKQGRAA